MKSVRLVLMVALFGLLAGVAHSQPATRSVKPKDIPPLPTVFDLRQNVPDPFCAGEIGSFTAIEFAMPQVAAIQLEVWSPDGSMLVRKLVNGTLQAGIHAVVWDGRDEAAAPVPPGVYPYRMIARDTGTGATLFEGQLLATVSCPTPVTPTAWGRLKCLYVTGGR